MTYLSTAFRSINEPHALLCWDDLTVGAAQRALTSSEMCVRARMHVRVPVRMRAARVLIDAVRSPPA